MVKIINPFKAANPIGDALRSAASSMYGDTLGPALKREQLLAAQRANVETQNTADMIAMFGQPGFNRAQLAATNYLAGNKGGELGDIERYLAANEYGFDDERTSNAMLGAGGAASSTPIGFMRDQARAERQNKYNTDVASGDRRYSIDVGDATERFKFNNSLEQAVVDGQPTFVRRGEAAGMAPVISESEQKGVLLGQNFDNLQGLDPLQRAVVGAEPKNPGTPRNYVAGGQNYVTYDGVTSAADGSPLPAGGYIAGVEGSAKDAGVPTSTINKGLQQGTAFNNFMDLADRTLSVAEQDPTLFGLTGKARSFAQAIKEGAGAAATLLGLSPEEASNLVGSEISRIAAGVEPGALNTSMLMRDFDPNLPDIQVLGNLMIYQAAEAVAGQEGRSLSDKDVEFVRGMVGDPQSWSMSQRSYIQRLNTLKEIVKQRQARNTQMMGVAAPSAPTTPAAPRPSGKTSRGTSWEVVE